MTAYFIRGEGAAVTEVGLGIVDHRKIGRPFRR